jgi:hypothetical protein
LRAAQIDRATIVPLDVEDDHFETIIDKIDPIDVSQIQWGTVTGSGPTAFNGEQGTKFQSGHIPGRPELSMSRCVRGYDYNTREYVDYEHPKARIYSESRAVEYDDDNGWHVKRYQHWLGQSVFRAKVGSGWRTFLSAFDYQERPPLYFLAEIPRAAKARTVEDALLALSPRIVHAAVAQGRDVKRQGDMFAIPTALTIRDLKRRYGRPVRRMQGVFGTDHVVTEQIVGEKGVTYARGVVHHRPGGLADHRRVRLGKEWHLIVPNTVPRRRGAMIRVPR